MLQLIKSPSPHLRRIWSIAPLEDGSFVSCSEDGSSKIWKRRDVSPTSGPPNHQLQLLGTFYHEAPFANAAGQNAEIVSSAVLKDSNTLITSSFTPFLSSLRLWSLQTFEMLHWVVVPNAVLLLLKSKGETPVLACMMKDAFDLRFLDHELSLQTSRLIKHRGPASCACTLSDGTFVSAGLHSLVKWGPCGTTLLNYPEPKEFIGEVEELAPGTFSTLSGSTMTVWSASEPVSLRSISLVAGSRVLAHQPLWLSRAHGGGFLTAAQISCDSTTLPALELWDATGNWVQSAFHSHQIEAFTRLRDGTMVVASCYLIEVIGFPTFSLVELCCQTIRKHRATFHLEKDTLPHELFVRCDPSLCVLNGERIKS
jgi:WD40 repeat protein